MLEIIPPSEKFIGTVKLPGSKSITNRALLLAALANGKSEIRNALKSDDTKYMANGLRKLGIKINEPDETTFIVFGKNGKLQESNEPLFLGNAGTATRFLTAAASLVDGTTIIMGDERMQKRPIQDLVDALEQFGVKIEYVGKKGCPPLRITSDGILKTDKEIKVRRDTSSQFLSAILMIQPFANIKKVIAMKALEDKKLVSPGYVWITVKTMETFGINFNQNKFGWFFTNQYIAQNFEVEADASSATYFLAAEKLLNQKIKISNLPKPWELNSNSIQPDTQTFEIIQKFPNLPSEINGINFPDAIPTLAVLAAFANGETRFTGISNLRVKECDRISACATELNKIKAGLAEEDGDDLIIHGDADLANSGSGAEIKTYNDHRIAMAFFLAGLKIQGIRIQNPKCVSKSFPSFFEVWEELGVKLRQI
jgi:3-phosphoshikimate 1-carboxyvinyltransferase